VVFGKLRDNNLKLSPKKCHLSMRSVRFLGHVIDQSGVAVDPNKVDVICKMPKEALMEEDGCTPSVKRLKSFLGMVFFYQSFISGCSAITKPLFALRWVPKLSSYNFGLKYILGLKNVVADALSRDPFTTSVSRRLIQDPYGNLVQEPEGAEAAEVQETFRLGVQHLQAVQQHKPTHYTAGSYSAAEVKAALASHSSWRSGVENRALCLGQHVQQLQPAGQCTLPSLCANWKISSFRIPQYIQYSRLWSEDVAHPDEKGTIWAPVHWHY